MNSIRGHAILYRFTFPSNPLKNIASSRAFLNPFSAELLHLWADSILLNRAMETPALARALFATFFYSREDSKERERVVLRTFAYEMSVKCVRAVNASVCRAAYDEDGINSWSSSPPLSSPTPPPPVAGSRELHEVRGFVATRQNASTRRSEWSRVNGETRDFTRVILSAVIGRHEKKVGKRM